MLRWVATLANLTPLQIKTRQWADRNVAQPLNRGYEPIRKFLNGIAPNKLGNFLPQVGQFYADTMSVGADVKDIARGGNKLFTKPVEGLSDIALGTAGLVPFAGDAAKAIALASMGITRSINGTPKTYDVWHPDYGKSGAGSELQGKPRVSDKKRLADLNVDVVERNIKIPAVDLPDFEGRPFVTTMSDRTAAGGVITDVNKQPLSNPVNLRGGQDYMFDPLNDGKVWASADSVVSGKEGQKRLLPMVAELKKQTGQNPLYLPWTMTPGGGDYATMTSEVMLSHALEVMPKDSARAFDKTMKEFYPQWAGIKNKKSIQQLRDMPPNNRFQFMNLLDKKYRHTGVMTSGEARLAVGDPKQYQTASGSLKNVGEVFAGQPSIMPSGHPTYSAGVPGRGLGELKNPWSVYEILPEAAQARNVDVKNPTSDDLRALQMKPYVGIIDDKLLKNLGY